MKNILLLSFLLTSLNYADLTVDQIRDMVTKIHEKREGISLSRLETTKEPFVRLQEEHNMTVFVLPKKAEETKLTLHAILNGKAYINNTWTSIDDTIGGFTLKYIGRKGVVLRNNNQIKKLFLHKERNNFIMLEGRE